MDSGGSISRAKASLMPTLAILTHELRTLGSSWLVRLWFFGSAFATFILVSAGWQQQQSAPLIAFLCSAFLVFPWFIVVIILGISPVTGNRLDALADGILSRPVTRYEYLFAAWAARVLIVLGVFVTVTVPAVVILAFANRPRVVSDDLTVYGIVASLAIVSLVLVFLMTLAFFVGTLLRNPLLAAAVLVFVWFPVNLILHTFSLEELSPISLSQALPTLLRTPWNADQAEVVSALSDEDAQAIAQMGRQFIATLSGGSLVSEAPREQGFFEKGDYTDLSVLRVVLGYGIPTLLALLLSTICFCSRDL